MLYFAFFSQVSDLTKHLDIETFRHNDACNMKPPKGMVPDEVRDNFSFIRKGERQLSKVLKCNITIFRKIFIDLPHNSYLCLFIWYCAIP